MEMKYDKQAEIARIGVSLIEMQEQVKDLNEKITDYKDEIAIFLAQNDIGVAEIPLGDGETLKISCYAQSRRLLDKDSLSAEINVAKDLLNAKGVCKLTEVGRLDSPTLEKHFKDRSHSVVKARVYVKDIEETEED